MFTIVSKTIKDQIHRKQLNKEDTSNVIDQFERDLIETDLFYLSKYVLGYQDLDYMHWQLCEHSDQRLDRELYLLPREHLKSTLMTIARSIQWLAQDPNKTILITSATLDNAKAFLDEIKQHIRGNERLRQLYPQFDIVNADDKVIPSVKWDAMRITLPRTKVVKEPSITVAGVGQSFASRHYDRIIFDDLLNEKNTENSEQIQKAIKWFQQITPIIKPEGILCVIGTRWDYGDLYEWMITTLTDFTLYIRKIKENGKLIFPRKFTEARYEALKRTMRSFLFSCQYYNEPVSADDQLFKDEYFRYLPHPHIEGIPGRKDYLVIDPATARNKNSDYTGMIVFGVDRNKKRYVSDIVRDKLSPQEQIDIIFLLVDKHMIDTVGIETVGFQSYIKFNLEREMEKRDRYFGIVELKPKGRKKEDRISALEPLFRAGQIVFASKILYTSIFLKQELDMVQILKSELIRFPKAAHDDLSDALAYVIDMDLWTTSVPETTKGLVDLKKMDMTHPDYEKLEDSLGISYNAGGMLETKNEVRDSVTGF